jgi:hypothetical protein
MKNSFSYLFVILLFFSIISCKKEKLLKDSDAKLEFSRDSILFDTVFTTIGSTTLQFKVYNRHDQPINISSIRIAKGSSSNFRMNVDGAPGISFSDIEIPAKDSIFVFVEVTVDPNNSNSPMMIQDSILFETNGNHQDIDLLAVGQDVYFHKPTNFTPGLPPYCILCNTTTQDSIWPNDKPHLIYGYAVVDSACSLTIQAGVKVYLHQGGGLWIYRKGNLKVLGTQAQPVIFQGDRLEPDYKDIPGQWDRIWINEGTVDNVIDWAEIRNGFIGLQTETLFSQLGNKLKLTNTKITNMSGIGIFTRFYEIQAGNTVVGNSGQYNLAITLGGSYSFRHCTFANYWNQSQRSTPSIYLNNYNSVQRFDLDSAYFGNCIVYGDKTNELELDSTNYQLVKFKFRFMFENCLMKLDPSINVTNPYHYLNIYKNQEPAFGDPSLNNYKINANSAAIDKGNISIGAKFPTDLDGKIRPNPSTGIPDLGAYEFY